MKTALAVFVLCVTLAALYLLRGPTEPAPELSPASPTAGGQVASSTIFLEVPEEERVASGKTHIFAASDSPLTRAELSELPTQLVLAGTLVIEESDGSETRDANGRFHLTTRVGELANGHVVQILEGRWSLRFELQSDGTYQSPDGGSNDASLHAARLSISEFVLYDPYGPVSELEDVDSLPFGDRRLELRVKRLHSLRIRVEDARNSKPLENLTLLRAGGLSTEHLRHPGYRSKFKIIAEEANSPVRLTADQRDANSGSANYLIGTPGYAWTSVAMDFGSDGERLVRLERGGNLEVLFAGDLPAAHMRLRLRVGDSEQSVAAFPLEDSNPIRIEGLAADTYKLEVDSGGRWEGAHRVWARGTARVSADGEAQVTLNWIPETPANYAPLAGTMVLPEEWQLTNFTLTAQPQNASEQAASMPYSLHSSEMEKIAGNTYAFKFKPLQIGKYRLELPALKYATTLELTDEGLVDFEFKIPPPVEILVTVLDELTGERAEVRQVQWSCATVEGLALFPPILFSPREYEAFNVDSTISPFNSRSRDDRGEDAGVFRLVVPETLVVITHLLTQASDYQIPSHTFQARAGGEFTLRVRSTCSATITLLDGDTKVPWPQSEFYTAEQIDGDGVATAIAGFLRADTPGRYSIEIPKIRGFEPHAAVEVEFRQGETRELTVQLIRE